MIKYIPVYAINHINVFSGKTSFSGLKKNFVKFYQFRDSCIFDHIRFDEETQKERFHQDSEKVLFFSKAIKLTKILIEGKPLTFLEIDEKRTGLLRYLTYSEHYINQMPHYLFSLKNLYFGYILIRSSRSPKKYFQILKIKGLFPIVRTVLLVTISTPSFLFVP
jgi:hypothetical protein